MSFSSNACLLALAGGMLSSAPAAAQVAEAAQEGTGEDSAASAAADAFGERVELNQVGLYSEWQTRGFDLNASVSAFRLDGFYFHPTAYPSSSIVSGSSVHVGIAATSLDLPSPTGVIGYRLRDPGDRSSLAVTTGWRGYNSPQLEALGTLVSDDRQWGLAAHTLIMPDDIRPSGQRGSTTEFGGVARWSPTPDLRLRLFGSYGRYRHDGSVTVLSTDEGVPPPLRGGHNYSPRWARNSARTVNAGALVDYTLGPWSLGASAIRSASRNPRSDVAVLEIDRHGTIASTLYHTPSVEARSDAFELKIGRTFPLLGAEHRIGVAVRQRRTFTGRAFATPFPAGSFTIDDGPEDIAPAELPETVQRGEDRINQRIISATYGLNVRNRFELRLGAHHNRYAKSVEDFAGDRFRNVDRTRLYSASAVWRPQARWHLFASYVSGLEEVGTAPSAASNRGEVLPPVEARQYELGSRFDITPRLALIAAAFDIRKETYGLLPNNLYAPVGTVRHRGLEASLTGRLAKGTTVVLGANLVQPRLSGELVDAGQVEKIAPGVSRFNATIGVEQRLTRRLMVDAYLLHEGGRRRDSASRVELPGVPFANIGARYDWSLGSRDFSLHGQVSNALAVKGYYATPYGPLVPVSRRSWRLLLTTTF